MNAGAQHRAAGRLRRADGHHRSVGGHGAGAWATSRCARWNASCARRSAARQRRRGLMRSVLPERDRPARAGLGRSRLRCDPAVRRRCPRDAVALRVRARIQRRPALRQCVRACRQALPPFRAELPVGKPHHLAADAAPASPDPGCWPRPSAHAPARARAPSRRASPALASARRQLLGVAQALGDELALEGLAHAQRASSSSTVRIENVVGHRQVSCAALATGVADAAVGGDLGQRIEQARGRRPAWPGTRARRPVRSAGSIRA